MSDSVKSKIRSCLKETEMELSKVCFVAVGLRCKLTVNIDINDGLVNGDGGTIEHIGYINKETTVLIWIKFDDEDVGRSLRFEYHKRSRSVVPTGTPIKRF